MEAYEIILLAVAVGILAGLIWRLASRRHELPCPVWLRWMVELDNPFAKTNRAASIVEHLELAEGMSVLDAGCGPGRVTLPVAERVGAQGRVVAMDIQDGMLSRVRKKARQRGVANIEFLNAGLGLGKLQTECFDRALLVTVLGEIPERLDAMKELFDALKPGGILSVTEVIFDPHFQRRRTVSRLAVEAGFEVKNVFGNAIAFTMNVRKRNHLLQTPRRPQTDSSHSPG